MQVGVTKSDIVSAIFSHYSRLKYVNGVCLLRCIVAVKQPSHYLFKYTTLGVTSVMSDREPPIKIAIGKHIFLSQVLGR